MNQTITMSRKMEKEKISLKKTSALVVVLGGGALLAVLLQGFLSFVSPVRTIAPDEAQEKIHEQRPADPFESITLEARAAYVFGLKTETVFFARNEHERLPLASITKLMTALLACEQFSESAVAVLTKDDLAAEGDSGLRPGERWRIGDLLNVMLLVSSNDAAHAVAGFVGASGHSSGQTANMSVSREHFVAMMNEKAHALGLTQTEFFNESGLDVNAVQAGGYGSAHDVAVIFSELWRKYPGAIDITSRKNARIVSRDGIAHILPNTNEVVGHIPGLIASKTGYTDLAGGNLAVIFDRGIGDPVLVVVLGSSYKGRFDDVQKLVEAARKFEISKK